MFKHFFGEVGSEIKEYENYTKMILPDDYKKFLLETNGGQFVESSHSFWVDEVKQYVDMDVLFGFGHARSLNLLDWYEEYCDELPENTAIIGNSFNAGLILLIWQDDWKGVFLWDHCLELEKSTEEDCLYRITDSFDLFYDKLIDIRKEV